MRCHLIPVRVVVIKIKGKCWHACGGKGTFVCRWWECKLTQPLWKSVWQFLRKLKVALPHDLEIPLLDMYPRELKSLCQRDSCTFMFISALFTITKVWKQPNCPLMDGWVICGAHIQ
jgi:hypothetical protein